VTGKMQEVSADLPLVASVAQPLLADVWASFDFSKPVLMADEYLDDDGFLSSTSRSTSSSPDTSSETREALHTWKRFVHNMDTGVPFYEVPKARYKWGQKQGHAHHVWAFLFFDLSYVGAAFKLGHMVGDSIDDGTLPQAMGLFIALFLVFQFTWTAKMAYDARFKSDDYVHRMVQVTLGCIVSFAATCVTTFEDLNNPALSNTLTISVSFLVYHVVESLHAWELVLSGDAHLRRTGYGILWQDVYPALIFVASIVSAVYGPLWLTALFWGLNGISWLLVILIRQNFRMLTRENTVPMHINWAIHRYNDFLLLMIGEGVISIIIVDFAPTVEYISTFILCYFLVGNITLILFATGAETDDSHALRRSSNRAMGFILLTGIQGMSLITVGVGFRLILTSLDSTSVELVWFMSISLLTCLLSFFVCRVLHHGIHEEYFNLPWEDKQKKIGFWFAKLSLIFVMLATPSFNAPPWGLMLWFWGLTSLLYFVHQIDLHFFKEYHSRMIAQEVEKRIEKYKAEGLEVEIEVKEKDHHGH